MDDFHPYIIFGRDICGDYSQATQREWLVTNGIGGYASGTISGALSRSYHGLLIAAIDPPVSRKLLLTKLDETLTYEAKRYPLFTNVWSNGLVDPKGFIYLECFHLEGTTPVWTYTIADICLEKRVWMQPRENTTYIRYHLRRGSAPVHLSLNALINDRDHHAVTKVSGDEHFKVETVQNGVQIKSRRDARYSLNLLSLEAHFKINQDWTHDFYLNVEAYRGLDPIDDNLSIGLLEADLDPGDVLTVVASTHSDANLDGESAYQERRSYESDIQNSAPETAPIWIRQLFLAADQFIVDRATPQDPRGKTIIAGYHWFTDWGRDTMISLPGLTLTTQRPHIAASILRTFAAYVDQGMLPNRFVDQVEGSQAGMPEYNTVDATLWYFEALRAYLAVTGDLQLMGELFPVLQDILTWHQKGTRYQIHVDPQDGLLFAGEPGVQLTWMDAKVDNWVVTPRIGKPVEINALWYNALCSTIEFAHVLGKSNEAYTRQAQRVRDSFNRFWYHGGSYLYDVIDGLDGPDASLRPNQLFAVSLHYSPLTSERQRRIVEVCSRELLTSHGLRSLTPNHPAYVGRYGGNRYLRDSAYHQGTVWGWLIGPLVSAHFRVFKQPDTALEYLKPLIYHLSDHGIGSISEIFDGDPPFHPRGCIAQAWSVAEVLRIWQQIELSRSRDP